MWQNDRIANSTTPAIGVSTGSYRMMLHSKSEEKWADMLSKTNDDPGSFWNLLKRLKARGDANPPLKIGDRTFWG